MWGKKKRKRKRKKKLRCRKEQAVFIGLVVAHDVVVVEKANLQQRGVGAEAHVSDDNERDELHLINLILLCPLN